MLPKRAPTANKQRKFRMTIGVGFLIVLFLIPQFRAGVRYTVGRIGIPVVYVSHSIGGWFFGTAQTFRFKSSLVSENKNLADQITKLNSKYANYDELIRENKDLKSAMNRADGKVFILANVLSKPPVSLYDTIIIDAGEKQGVLQGATVYVNGNVPIGTVSEVMSGTSLIQLYSSPSQKMDARIDPLGIDVTLFGHGGGNFLVSVPHDVTVPQNAIVVSKEVNPHVLGVLQKTISDPRDSSQTLIFSTPINLNQLNFVEVEK